jgi:SnoaL-like domain
MMTFATHCSRAATTAAAVALCLLAALAPTARAEDISAKILADRAQIQDLITRYYYNFGKEKPESFSDFYADDAELILGTTHFKGKDGIAKAYGHRDGSSPAPKPYSFIVTISNPLIVIHGDSATSQVIFTEFLMDKQGDAPHIRTQGKEYGTFIRVNGRWRYKTRQVKGGTELPEGWKD